MSNLALKTLAVIALLSVLLVGGLIFYDFVTTRGAFPSHTFIEKVDVSGLDAKQAAAALARAPLSSLFPGVITFRNTRESFSFSPEELGIHVLPAETASNALHLLKSGSYVESLKRRMESRPIILPAKFSLVEEKALDVVFELARQLTSPAVDARITLDEKTGAHTIFPDSPGRKMRALETFANLKHALEKGESVARLDIEYFEEPKITEEELRASPPVHLLSSYTTYYGTHDSPNRIHNIKLVSSWLNNTLMMPGEVFSSVERIGDFTAERGFKEAFVIVQGELVPLLGGGACQIGTTLYNAVALADIEVLSRRNHSFYFNIYPLGRDATIFPGSIDFKFKNDTGHPILIKAYADNRRHYFKIYGTPTGKKAEFSPAQVFELKDGRFHPSSLRSVIASDNPFRTVVKRTVRDAEGKVIKEETIRSFYRLYGEKRNVPIRRPEPR